MINVRSPISIIFGIPVKTKFKIKRENRGGTTPHGHHEHYHYSTMPLSTAKIVALSESLTVLQVSKNS